MATTDHPEGEVDRPADQRSRGRSPGPGRPAPPGAAAAGRQQHGHQGDEVDRGHGHHGHDQRPAGCPGRRCRPVRSRCEDEAAGSGGAHPLGDVEGRPWSAGCAGGTRTGPGPRRPGCTTVRGGSRKIAGARTASNRSSGVSLVAELDLDGRRSRRPRAGSGTRPRSTQDGVPMAGAPALGEQAAGDAEGGQGGR